MGLGRDGTSHGTYESRFVPIPSGQACVQKKLVKQSDATKTPSWMTNDALGQGKQRDYISQKSDILSFQGPTAFLPYSKVFLYHVTDGHLTTRARFLKGRLTLIQDLHFVPFLYFTFLCVA